MAKNGKTKEPSLGDMVDQLYDMDQQRIALGKEVTALEKKQREMEEYLLNEYKKTELEGAEGKRGKVSLIRETVPTVEPENWNTVFAYIGKTKSYDMLYKRLNTKAVRERWDAGEEVPSVTRFNKIKFSITKAV